MNTEKNIFNANYIIDNLVKDNTFTQIPNYIINDQITVEEINTKYNEIIILSKENKLFLYNSILSINRNIEYLQILLFILIIVLLSSLIF